ncbi:sulfurtransferase [Haloarcula rubripromontorii]|uniref:Sulfurtransferase n=1 Tax=Haloarcula rubripromontorii TaxID=1705562 RepID=A0A0M9AMU4_9EURY|nr:sulfurtransferase [Haloarcula rubripromontorii]KOX94055.1 thiosulfate sulfurtransferase [Haloarcula rubripromontorii]
MSGQPNQPQRVKDALVTPEWLERRLDTVASDSPDLRLVEVDLSTDFYAEAHIPGAVSIDWRQHLQHETRRDIPSKAALSDRLGTRGITEQSTLVLYGDSSNWFAAHLYWMLQYYGHEDVSLLDGGRRHWIESGRPTSDSVPSYTSRSYRPRGPCERVRAYRHDVQRALSKPTALVDVRLPEEYDGTILAPPGMTESAQRGGHIPGAANIVWSKNLRSDGRFKSLEALRRVYREYDIDSDRDVIVYCRIGERSSLTWFVLSELLGYSSVRNYDGAWTEWGNLVAVPVATGRP